MNVSDYISKLDIVNEHMVKPLIVQPHDKDVLKKNMLKVFKKLSQMLHK